MTPVQDPTMVVCIDGPTRGRLRAITGTDRTRFLVYEMPLPPISIHDPSAEWSDTFLPALNYYVHKLSFLGFDIMIASMQINASNINPYDVITTLFNESARQATYRANNV